MSKDNENTLSKEFSKLADHFLPDNMLIKGIETLGKMKGDVILLDNALQELALSSDHTASQLKTVTEEAFRLGDATGKSGTEILSYINSAKKHCWKNCCFSKCASGTFLHTLRFRNLKILPGFRDYRSRHTKHINKTAWIPQYNRHIKRGLF